MIHVIATIEVVPGQRDNFLDEFHGIVDEVRSEKGCLAYEPTVDVETNLPNQLALRPNVVTIVETWKSLEDLEAHLVAPHMVAYRHRVKELVEGTSLQVLQSV
jgi:quinol monooxygenase YgiN